MSNEAKDKAFEQIWPKCFVTFMAIVELLAVILLFLTELGNVAANFWKTNVFAGGWGGLILLLHVIFLFVAGCCSPSCPAAFRAVILTLLALVASAAMVSFDVAFILRPDACLLTPDCLSNDRSNSSFADSFQESFLVTFRNIDMFKSYSESQIKLLFQAIQIGVAAVCFIICLIYLIVYFVHDKKATQHIASQAQQSSGEVRPPSQALGAPMNTGFYPAVAPPAPMNNLYPAIPPGYFPPRAVAPLPQNYYRQPPPQAWGALPRIPQPQPGEVPWNNGGRY